MLTIYKFDMIVSYAHNKSILEPMDDELKCVFISFQNNKERGPKKWVV